MTIEEVILVIHRGGIIVHGRIMNGKVEILFNEIQLL